MIDELSALKSIEERFHKTSSGVKLGIGDDAAAVIFDSGKLVLATTDSQVEDVHFVKSLISPSLLARRAVAVSVSDIGAMGGVPRYILATAGFSKFEDEGFLDDLISGFIDSEKEFGVEIIGGNLSSTEKLFIDITVLGEVEPDIMVKRDGAIAGDLVFVSGTLGDSALGLKMLQDGESCAVPDYLMNRHLCPMPRLRLGRELAMKKLATSMIDVSDGLLIDLERISVHKGAGSAIDIAKLPLSNEYDEIAALFYNDKYEGALSGGEDYELLFTSPEHNRQVIQELSESLNLQITEIGKITNTGSVELFSRNGEAITIKQRGFVHFNS